MPRGPGWTAAELSRLREQAPVLGNNWSKYDVPGRPANSIGKYCKKLQQGKINGQNAAEWKALFESSPNQNTSGRNKTSPAAGVDHVSHVLRSDTFEVRLSNTTWDGSKIVLIGEGKLHDVEQAKVSRDAGMPFLLDVMALGEERPKGVSDDDVKNARAAAVAAAMQAANDWAAERGVKSPYEKVEVPKRYPCPCPDPKCKRGNDRLWQWKYILSAACARLYLQLFQDPDTKEWYYIDPETGETMPTDGWLKIRGELHPGYELMIAPQFRGLQAARDAALALREMNQHSNVMMYQRYRLDGAFRANRLADQRAKYQAKVAVLEEEASSIDVDLSSQPTAEQLIDEVPFAKILEANPGAGLLLNIWKGTVDRFGSDFEVRKNEQVGAFIQPGRANPVLTPDGTHMRHSSMGVLGRDLKSPDGKVSYTFDFGVHATDAAAFAGEKALVAAAHAAKSALDENISSRICILNTTEGGNGSRRKTKYGLGAAGYTLLVVEPDDFRFNESSGGLTGWLDQLPAEFRNAVPMNAAKVAILKRDAERAKERRDERKAAKKRKMEERLKELNEETMKPASSTALSKESTKSAPSTVPSKPPAIVTGAKTSTPQAVTSDEPAPSSTAPSKEPTIAVSQKKPSATETPTPRAAPSEQPAIVANAKTPTPRAAPSEQPAIVADAKTPTPRAAPSEQPAIVVTDTKKSVPPAAAGNEQPPAKKLKSSCLYNAQLEETVFTSPAKYFEAMNGFKGYRSLSVYEQGLVEIDFKKHNKRAEALKRSTSKKPAKDFFGRPLKK